MVLTLPRLFGRFFIKTGFRPVFLSANKTLCAALPVFIQQKLHFAQVTQQICI